MRGDYSSGVSLDVENSARISGGCDRGGGYRRGRGCDSSGGRGRGDKSSRHYAHYGRNNHTLGWDKFGKPE